MPRRPERNPATAAAPQRVRIIGGQWRRTLLPVADLPGLRPTPDRVRETLFNWLGQDLSGWRCVDLFAGSGALGFEAASRGAQSVQMFEADTALVKSLNECCRRLGAQQVQVRRGDGVALARELMAAPGAALIDLAFIDPPYAADLFDSALRAVRPALKPEGRVYLEAPVPWDEAALQPLGYHLLRHLKAGAVHAHLLAPTA